MKLGLHPILRNSRGQLHRMVYIADGMHAPQLQQWKAEWNEGWGQVNYWDSHGHQFSRSFNPDLPIAAFPELSELELLNSHFPRLLDRQFHKYEPVHKLDDNQEAYRIEGTPLRSRLQRWIQRGQSALQAAWKELTRKN